MPYGVPIAPDIMDQRGILGLQARFWLLESI